MIFDFWGTLAETGVRSPLRLAQNILGLQDMDYSEFVMRFERGMMTRHFDDLQAAFTVACHAFDIQPDEALLTELVGMWNKNWLLAQLYPDTLSVLTELKKHATLVLISNTDCFSVAKVLDKYGLRDFFHAVFLSCEVGMLKNDPAFYEKVLHDVGVRPEQCLAVGDSIETDIVAAQQVGVRAVLVDRRGRREFPLRIIYLQELIDNGTRFFGHEWHAADERA